MDELRFREIFARAPVSIWEEDFSAVGEWLASLRASGVTDLNRFLQSEPQALQRALSLVRLVEINEVTLRLWEVGSKEELLERWTDLFTDETFEVFAGELLAIWEGRNEVTFHCSARTATGRSIHYEMHWVAPMVGGEMNLHQVIVAIVDVTEHKQTEEALRRTAELTRRLSPRLLEVQERERTHLARELHDEFGQLGAQHEQRTGNRTRVKGHLSAVPDEIGIACYRVVQEALTNIARHASAQHVWIDLGQEANALLIEVRDDGVGFKVEDAEKSLERIRLGLVGMKERIESLGGQLGLEAEPGIGTTVRISLPIGTVG